MSGVVALKWLSAGLLAAFCAVAGGDDDWPQEVADNPHQVGADERRFLSAAADDGWLHVEHRLTIGAHSLTDGWVDLEQCYANLDAIDAVDVVYRYREIRGLTITAASGIGAARADQQTISLSNVEQGARLCARAAVRILQRSGENRYVMHNGPFHRRFLDGYFPMRLTLNIDYPAALLRFSHAEPAPQPGFAIDHSDRGLRLDTRFTGMLRVVFHFTAAAD